MKREWILWAVILLPVVLYLCLLPGLPAEMPSHFNAAGKADAWMSPGRFLLTLVPVNILLYAVFLALPHLDPRKSNYFLFSDAYYYLRLAVHLFLSAVFCFVLASAAGWKLDVVRLTGLCVMLLLVILGLLLGQVRPNSFIGIRTPWTLRNETVWRKTHRTGGRWMSAIGLAGAVIILVLPAAAVRYVILPVILLAVFFPFVYSMVLYKSEKNKA